ncbi:MAG: capsular biosynthesis protein [Sphingobium sp.]
MKHAPIQQRNILFLQGPPGPFFWLLAQRLHAMGHGIHRINLNGGDQGDWPGKATDYHGTQRRWVFHVDQYMRDNAITDIMLFGDCRPMHMAAHQMAKLREIRVHVFEEGYIRPDWVTLEPSGVNGRSSLPRDPQWYRDQARDLPPVPDRPTITASFARRAHDAYWYYHRTFMAQPIFPFYRSHRPGSIIIEGFGWLAMLARRKRMAEKAAATVAALADKSYFLFPLQLTNDYQIRAHSPFNSMVEGLEYVASSFARSAPANAVLLVKEHPLDFNLRNWEPTLTRLERQLKLTGRLVHIAGGDLEELAIGSRGMVTINSTSATLALRNDVPTIALGTAIYDMPDVTHQGKLDDFWIRPSAPDAATYQAFQRVLHDRCLVYGGFASQSAVETLVASTVDRLTRHDSALQPVEIVPFG